MCQACGVQKSKALALPCTGFLLPGKATPTVKGWRVSPDLEHRGGLAARTTGQTRPSKQQLESILSGSI